MRSARLAQCTSKASCLIKEWQSMDQLLIQNSSDKKIYKLVATLIVQELQRLIWILMLSLIELMSRASKDKLQRAFSKSQVPQARMVHKIWASMKTWTIVNMTKHWGRRNFKRLALVLQWDTAQSYITTYRHQSKLSLTLLSLTCTKIRAKRRASERMGTWFSTRI